MEARVPPTPVVDVQGSQPVIAPLSSIADRATRRCLGLASLGLLMLAGGCAPDAGQRRDTVLILIDTLRPDHMSLYDYGLETTPSIDAWAQDGLVFENATSGSSWTVPATWMLLSGRYLSEGPARFDERSPSIASEFQGNGYRTGAVVANAILVRERGFDEGFEHYELRPLPGSAEGGSGEAALDSWSGSEVSDRAEAWWRDHDGEPRFLYLHLFDPHAPYRAPFNDPFGPIAREELQATLEHLRLNTPEKYAGRATRENALKVARFRRQYDLEVLEADRGVGQFLDFLDERDELNETVIALTSDHGEGLWQRPHALGEPDFVAGTAYPVLYMGHGTQLFSEQVRVPLALTAPGLEARGRVQRAFPLVDLKAQLLRLATSAHPNSGEAAAALIGAGPDEVYAACSRAASVTLNGRWRLHMPQPYRVERFGAEPELFDLAADPLETRPLEDSARFSALRASLESWRERYAHQAEVAPSEADRERRRRQLEALGYADMVDHDE